MNSIATTLHPPPIPLLHRPFLHLHHRHSPLLRRCSAPISAASSAGGGGGGGDIEMVRGRDGVWTSGEQKVVVLWDLDNKPPRGPPYSAALALRRLAALAGRVVDISAYANRHAFAHLPDWVRADRRDRRRLDTLERKGLAVPPEPYLCAVCGRRCRTNLDLTKHFRQLHEREREKKLARMRSLKGKKRQRYRERFVSGNHKYEEAARSILRPKSGYGLAPELRRAGVFVKTVEDKPQAADAALKRQMQHSLTRGIDWLFLVSDDSDFSDMIRRARDAGLQTVVVGDGRRSLGVHADIWVPWAGVENGEVDAEALFSDRTQFHEDDYDDEKESLASDSDDIVDGIFVGNSGLGVARISAFSEEDDDIFQTFVPSPANGQDLFWDSEEEDGYI